MFASRFFAARYWRAWFYRALAVVVPVVPYRACVSNSAREANLSNVSRQAILGNAAGNRCAVSDSAMDCP